MSSLVLNCLSSYYQSDLLLLTGASGISQIISNDVAQAYLKLVPPLIYRVCHHSRHNLFLRDHKSIVTCVYQLRLVGHITTLKVTKYLAGYPIAFIAFSASACDEYLTKPNPFTRPVCVSRISRATFGNTKL
jgi:hypothetical protein